MNSKCCLKLLIIVILTNVSKARNLFTKASKGRENTHKIKERSVIYPTGSILQLSMGIGLNTVIDEAQFVTNVGFQQNVPLPTNITVLREPPPGVIGRSLDSQGMHKATENADESDVNINSNNARTKEGRRKSSYRSAGTTSERDGRARPERSEWKDVVDYSKNLYQLYRLLEIEMGRYGFHGETCLLKSICEMASTTFHGDGALENILLNILSPSRHRSSVDNSVKNEQYMKAELIGSQEDDGCRTYASLCPITPFSLIAQPEPVAASATSEQYD